MAGGQERILRRRIRTVQATKKITRAMELIAASRIVKAQARIAAAAPVRRAASPTCSADRGAPAPRRNAAAVGRGPSHRSVPASLVIAADRGLCGGLQLQRAARRRAPGASRRRRSRRRATAWSPSGKKAAGLLPLPRHRGRAGVRPASPTARPTRTPRPIAAAVTAAVPGRRGRPGPASSPPGSCRPGTQVVETRQLLPLCRSRRRRATTRPRPPTGLHRVRARIARRDPRRRCCPATSRARVFAALLEAAAS